MNLDGAFTQNGAGLVSTAGDITTTADAINFTRAVTLTGDVALDTGAGAGTITFNSIVKGTQALALDAGSGNIDFDGAVGSGLNQELGAVTVVSAANLVADSTIEAASLNVTTTTSAEFKEAITLTGDFTNSGGATTFSGTSKLVSVGGNFVIDAGSVLAGSSLIEVDGNWDNNAGVGGFTAVDSTVTFAGAAASTSEITGSTTFNKFICITGGKILKFETSGDGSVIQTIADLTLTGTKGNLVEIRPITDAQHGYINVTEAAPEVDFVKVEYSNNQGNDIVAHTSSNLGVSNPGWDLDNVKWTADANTSVWTTTDNWDSGEVPTQYDGVQIQDTNYDPHLGEVNSTVVFNNLDIDAGAILDIRGCTLQGTASVNNLGSIINNADTESDNIIITAPDIRTGTITNNVNGGVITLTGTIDISNNITSDAGTVTFDGATTISAENAQVSTDALVAGDIEFTGAINGQAGLTRNLTLTAGTGSITVTGAVGATPLTSLTVSNASQLDLDNVITSGDQSYTATNIDLNNITYTSTAGAITFANPVDLDAAGTITVTSGAGTNDDIEFSSTVKGAKDLVLNAGASGDVTFGGAVGTAVTPLSSLDATGSDISINAAITTSGAQVYTGRILQNSSTCDLTTTGAAGAITFNGVGTAILPSQIHDIKCADDLRFSLKAGVASAVYNINSTIDVDGDVAIDDGVTVVANDSDWTVAGSWDNNADADTTPDVTPSGFDCGTSSVTFDAKDDTSVPDATITGNTTFYDLACFTAGKTLIFEAERTQAIDGEFAIGPETADDADDFATEDDYITLRSTLTGTDWEIDFDEKHPDDAIDYVNVLDSNKIGGHVFPWAKGAGAPTGNYTLDSLKCTSWFEARPPDDDDALPPEVIPEVVGPTFMLDMPLDTDVIAFDLDFLNTKKFWKTYDAGKYKTVVVVFEGRVSETPYNEGGLEADETTVLTGGQRTERKGEVYSFSDEKKEVAGDEAGVDYTERGLKRRRTKDGKKKKTVHVTKSEGQMAEDGKGSVADEGEKKKEEDSRQDLASFRLRRN